MAPPGIWPISATRPRSTDQSDIDLRPFLRRQIDRNEWSKAGLDVGDKEDEPVEAALALFDGGGARAIPAAAVTCRRVHRWTARPRLTRQNSWRDQVLGCGFGRADSGISSPRVSGRIAGLQAAGGAEHHDRRILLVFGCCLDLLQRQFERHAFLLVGSCPEVECVPVDDDLSAADAEEAAEIDDRGTHCPSDRRSRRRCAPCSRRPCCGHRAQESRVRPPPG